MYEMLRAQRLLQIESMKDGDPRTLEGEKLVEFIRWNVLALENELHEMLQEVKWKPWAKVEEGEDRIIDRTRFIKELVDAFHFFMNLVLAGAPAHRTEEIAGEFAAAYFEKNRINAQRQAEGYTGKKCPVCGRAVEEARQTPAHESNLILGVPKAGQVEHTCPCGAVYVA